MTVDTSRPAVEALIAEASKVPLGSSYWSIVHHLSRSLAALLDERDRLAANRDAWVSDAMTSTTELEQRIRDLEAELGTSRRQFTTLARSIDGLRSRAERAEAELLHARGISEIRGAEGDKLDAVKAFIANRSVIGGMDRMRLQAILADTETREEGDL